MTDVTETLAALRDVRGVEGSLYASRDGAHLRRDLPAIYDGEPLDGLASRVGRMLDALVDVSGEPEGMLVRTSGHAVFLKPTDHGVLVVLAASDVSVAALKRGANLVARRLPDLAAEARASSPGTRPATLPPPPPPRVAPTRVMTPPPLPSPAAAPRTSATPSPPAAPDITGAHATFAISAASTPAPGAPAPFAPGNPRESTSGLIAPRLSAPRASVPGAPASPARKWRGSTVK